MRPLLQRLGERKLARWAVAYLAGAWVVYQVLEALGEPWGVSDGLLRGSQVAAFVGFFIMLVLVWYHGEQGRQRLGGTELLILTALVAIGVVGIRVALVSEGADQPSGDLATGGPSEDPASIAVMPCDDQSPGGDQAPLAQGLAEGIINALVQLPNLKVSGINSVIALLEQNADVATIARTLDVSTVLTCSLQQAGDVIRVRSRLVDATTRTVLWSEQIDRPGDNVFAIQDQVARAVTDQLQVVLDTGEEEPVVAQGTAVPEAHRAYLRGRYLWSQREEETIRTAIAEFQRAVDMDGTYAEAFSGLADAYIVLDAYTMASDRPDFRTNMELAIQAGRTAVTIAPDLGMAHASLGLALWGLGDWDEAEEEFNSAIRLSPGWATAHHWYSILLSTVGRPQEALVYAERALDIDPASRVISRNLGRVLEVAGRTEDAIAQFRETTVLAPGWWYGWFELSRLLTGAGEYDEGLEAWSTAGRVSNAHLQNWTEAYQAVVRHQESLQPQTSSDLGHALYPQYWSYAHSGQLDQAIELFGDAVRRGALGTAAYLHVMLTPGQLRDDPRYVELILQAGFTW